MNAQPSTPTQSANTGRSRANIVLFAGLFIFAAVIIGGVFALSQRTPAAAITARGPTNHPLIAQCRPCQDEVLAARQGSALSTPQAAQPTMTSSGARALITNCRSCRDEALGANQASPQTADGGTIFSHLNDPRRPGPR